MTMNPFGSPARARRRLRAGPVEPLHPAPVRGADVLRDEAPRPLHQAVRGPHHLPRRAGRRRVGGRHHRPAHRAGVAGPGPRHPHVHQQPGWLVHRHDGDLRHDAVHPAGHPDVRHRPGRLRGRGAARPPAPRASGSRCPTRGSSSTSPRWAAATTARRPTSRSRPTRSSGCATWLEDTLARHTGRTPSRSARTSSATRSCPRRTAKEYGLIDEVLRPARTRCRTDDRPTHADERSARNAGALRSSGIAVQPPCREVSAESGTGE